MVVVATAGCGSSHPERTPDGGVGVCEGLFGLPNDKTGLTAEQCQPQCTCGGQVWKAKVWDEASVQALREWTLLDPPSGLSADPYLDAPPAVPDGSVCAVVVVDHDKKTYRLKTFASWDAAEAAGAIVTHGGICGLCSPLSDLAVYAGEKDLTTPVRACGLQNLGDFDGDKQCLLQLGFSSPCADIWAYNTMHTATVCNQICLSLLDAPYNVADGGINDCLACDEHMSGPVFKAYAGRTRRNTGVPSAICRPCSTVLHIEHDYE